MDLSFGSRLSRYCLIRLDFPQAKQICREHTSAPSLLNSIYNDSPKNNTMHQFRQPRMKPVQYSLYKCTCRPKSFGTAIMIPAVELHCRFSIDHLPSCPYYRASTSSWTVGLWATLLPLIEKTVEMTLDTTFDTRDCSISPIINVRNLVKMKRSPTFQLFESAYKQYMKDFR